MEGSRPGSAGICRDVVGRVVLASAQAVSYDIKLGRRSHDVVAKRGFLTLLRCWAAWLLLIDSSCLDVPGISKTLQNSGLGMQCLDGAAIIAGPPCSLQIFMLRSCS